MSRTANGDGTGGLARARSILLTALGVEIVVLVVTGVALWFLYTPTEGQAWSDVFTNGREAGVRLADAIRLVHRLTSILAFPTAVAAGVLLAFRGRVGTRRWAGVPIGVGIALTTVAVSVTGYLLPWDQLALWAVTVGTNIRGYRWLTDDTVRFVLIGGTEVTKGTVLGWLVIHALVLTPALVGLVVVGIRRTRQPRRQGVTST